MVMLLCLVFSGMLGIALILFVLRLMYRKAQWNDRLLGFSFWAFNIGLLLMLLLSLLPIGIMQTVASIGSWHVARSLC